jgi:DNA-binding FadR family transcriptional regulator
VLTKLDIAPSDDALTRLESLIGDGGYAPGDRLPPERELIVNLGVTRSALRKALDELERAGAIWRHVGKGTFVAARGGATAMSGLVKLSQQVSPADLMRARLSIEPAIAREAAINASGDAVARLRAVQDRALAAPTWDEYEAQDDSFHRGVAEATGNLLLLSLFDHLNEVKRAVAWDSVVRSTERPPRDHSSFAEHEDIFSAIAAHDQAAAHAAMRKHLGSVAARLFG